MTMEVSVRGLHGDPERLLRKAEAGEKVVIVRGGKPVADLVPHDAEPTRWLSPAEVMEIREIASGDPTWGMELAAMRAADELEPIP